MRLLIFACLFCRENFEAKRTHDSQDENVTDISNLSTGNPEVYAKLAEPLNTDVDEKLMCVCLGLSCSPPRGELVLHV